MKLCAFNECKLGPDNFLVPLRENVVLDTTYYEGQRVCALHYTPRSSQQLKYAKQTGHVEPGAVIGIVSKQYKATSKEKRLANKEKKLKLQQEQKIG